MHVEIAPSSSRRPTRRAPAESAEVRPFRIAIPQRDVDELRRRLGQVRWPGELPGVGWSRGVPVAYLRALAERWRSGFDWREQEDRLNALSQFTTMIDGQRMHFVHVRSREKNAVPLLLLHGWPGSFVEFVELVGPLTDPRAFGGRPEDAFDVVIPSLPGHGFSTPLSSTGWNHARMAKAFVALMERLGYPRYGVQGGDVGAFIAPLIGRFAPERVLGVHVNALPTFASGAPDELAGLTASEQTRLDRFHHYRNELMGYAHIQGTRPQTLAYALTDSPVGQLAWIAEKFKEWTDPHRELPEDAVDLDQLLTNVSLYWFTGTAGSAGNLYYETFHDPSAWAPKPRGTVPTAVAVFLQQDVSIRRFAEREHHVVRWSEFEHGGHFAAMEQPGVLLRDLTEFFRTLR